MRSDQCGLAAECVRTARAPAIKTTHLRHGTGTFSADHLPCRKYASCIGCGAASCREPRAAASSVATAGRCQNVQLIHLLAHRRRTALTAPASWTCVADTAWGLATLRSGEAGKTCAPQRTLGSFASWRPTGKVAGNCASAWRNCVDGGLLRIRAAARVPGVSRLPRRHGSNGACGPIASGMSPTQQRTFARRSFSTICGPDVSCERGSGRLSANRARQSCGLSVLRAWQLPEQHLWTSSWPAGVHQSVCICGRLQLRTTGLAVRRCSAGRLRLHPWRLLHRRLCHPIPGPKAAGVRCAPAGCHEADRQLRRTACARHPASVSFPGACSAAKKGSARTVCSQNVAARAIQNEVRKVNWQSVSIRFLSTGPARCRVRLNANGVSCVRPRCNGNNRVRQPVHGRAPSSSLSQGAPTARAYLCLTCGCTRACAARLVLCRKSVSDCRARRLVLPPEQSVHRSMQTLGQPAPIRNQFSRLLRQGLCCNPAQHGTARPAIAAKSGDTPIPTAVRHARS